MGTSKKKKPVQDPIYHELDDLHATVKFLRDSLAANKAATDAAFTVSQRTTQAHMDTLRLAIGEERTARLKLAQEQRSYVDAQDRDILRRLDAHRACPSAAEASWWSSVKAYFVGQEPD